MKNIYYWYCKFITVLYWQHNRSVAVKYGFYEFSPLSLLDLDIGHFLEWSPGKGNDSQTLLSIFHKHIVEIWWNCKRKGYSDELSYLNAWVYVKVYLAWSLPVLDLDSEAIISGEPLTNKSKCWLPRVLAMTDILCNLDENVNWRIIPTS